IQLANTSTGAIAYEWDLGNGTHSEFENPEATYQARGDYVITLVASNQFNCHDTAQSNINIYPMPVVQSVDVQSAEGCGPLEVHFSVNASDGNQYIWNFGDGETL